ncbi:MAG: hypothetical protein N3G76_02610 [Candidatus Micrarchaeota archaeon]|nr:hypothetical protein [Candidatus Micrarchaeota archaeon]
MVLDENVKKIILGKLKEWEGETITVARLGELRELITKKTGKHKFVPYTNIRKWIREVKKESKAMEKARPEKGGKAQAVPQPSTPQIPKHTGPVVVAMQPSADISSKAVISPFADRVYFQNLTYELSAMRRNLERISKQLDELEAQLKEMGGK